MTCPEASANDGTISGSLQMAFRISYSSWCARMNAKLMGKTEVSMGVRSSCRLHRLEMVRKHEGTGSYHVLVCPAEQ